MLLLRSPFLVARLCSVRRLFRIEFKFLLLIFKAIKGFAPGYITELINVKNKGRLGYVPIRVESYFSMLNLKRIRQCH